MIFVRNPTGISHAAGEASERADCLLGIEGLAAALSAAAGEDAL
jgi:N-carbamoyl-L-amino-acid hydrolase